MTISSRRSRIPSRDAERIATTLAAPPALRPGDRVCAFAGSSPFDATLVWRGLGWLAGRYTTRFDRAMFERRGYLAGGDDRRLSELQRHLDDPTARALVAARGGYGLSRIVHRLSFDAFLASPAWVVGFSDVTALHVELARLGVQSLHAPHLTAVGRGDRVARTWLLHALEQPNGQRIRAGLTVMVPGRSSSVWGPLFGGNLALLQACAAAGRLHPPEGAVWFIEDVTERPYRIDRMLTTLVVGGYLDTAGAVVVGQFSSCAPGPDGVRVEDVVAEVLAPLNIPVVSGLSAGHDLVNEPLALGAPAHVVVQATSPDRAPVGGLHRRSLSNPYPELEGRVTLSPGDPFGHHAA